MVVWVIGRNYPLPENGMQGSFELEQAKMLSRHGDEVHYLACSLHPIKKIKGKRGLQAWTDEGVNVTVLSALFPPRIFPFYCVKQRNRHWKSLFQTVERSNGIPDVIHVHYPAMLMMADALQDYREKGVRIVATEHWTKVLTRKLDLIELREFRKYTHVLDNIIAVGSPLNQAVKDLTGLNGVVVPNIVNELFQVSGEPHEGFRFVAVGRLIKLKQFDQIMEAFCDCFLGQKNITLTIIGGGEEKKHLQELITKYKASSQIRLLGMQDRKTTAATVSHCDSLVCFSTFETFCVPVIEAWACGLPVITTTTAAVIIDHPDERLGRRVSYDDYTGLKDALRYVYTHRMDYDKAFISSYAKTHFSEEVIYRRLIEIYGE